MTATITLQSKIVAALVPLIEANPGITSKALAQLGGYSLSHVKNGLLVLSREKVASPIPLGARNRGWAIQAVAEPIIKAWCSVKRKQSIKSAEAPPTQRAMVVGIAAEADGAGAVKVSARIGISERDSDRICAWLTKRGILFGAERENCRKRWFSSQEHAAEWSAMPAPAVSELRPKSGRPPSPMEVRNEARKAAFAEKQAKRAAEIAAGKIKPRVRKSRAKAIKVIKAAPGVAAPVYIPKPKLAQEVDYSKAKLTICASPTHDDRYQFAPGTVITGEFSSQWRQLRAAA